MGLFVAAKPSIDQVGLIGCGTMGRCMLKSMIEKGYKVTAYDVFEAAAEKAKALGANTVKTPAEVAEVSDVILMSLPGPIQLEEVTFGENGIASKISAGKVLVDLSTVDPGTTKKIAERLEPSTGAAYLDCPVLGRPSATGKWMLPSGGSAEALNYVKPVLKCFASDAILVGDHGAGNALKLLNQMMFSCINAISSEVLAIAPHVGIDPKVFYDTVASSSAATVSGLFKEVGKFITTDDYSHPAFTVDLLIKDTKLALQMAKDADAPSVIAGNVQLYNEIAHADGLGGQDTSALYKIFCKHYEREEK